MRIRKLTARAAVLATGLVALAPVTANAATPNGGQTIEPMTINVAKNGHVELIVHRKGRHVYAATVQVLGPLMGTVKLEYTTSRGGTKTHNRLCDQGGATICAWQFQVKKTYPKNTVIAGGAKWNGKWIGIPEYILK
ncbi:hypothetical protein [Actinoallomurus sp. CA-150999]|uniref:hypothetical protein n=1 Tax=Actinoallomurus sp. CA-150999 TaxID=3239887 RepID=UPI003D949B19